MYKKYLDILYELRSNIISKIEVASSLSKEPMYKCCENMVFNNPYINELTLLKSELNRIDMLIENYIKIHK